LFSYISVEGAIALTVVSLVIGSFSFNSGYSSESRSR